MVHPADPLTRAMLVSPPEGFTVDSNHTEGLKIQRVVFLALFGALFVLVARLFKPFFSILLWASLVYGISLPLFRRSTTTKAGLERNKAWQTVMAVTFSVGSLFLIVVPLTLLVLALAGQVQDLVDITLAFIERGETFMHSDGFASLAAKLTELSGGLVDLHAIDVADQLASMIGAYGERIIGITAELVRNVTGFIVTLAFFVFVLFFLYLDGRELLMTLIDAIPLRNAYTIRFMRKFRDTGKDLAIGYILMAAFQGAMGFLVYWIMGVPAPLPLAILTGIASLIPLVGTGLVWVPLVAVTFMGDNPGRALLLLVLCVVFISSLDNFIRPFLLHARIKLHPLLIFIAIIGGIDFFGFNGVLLGPILLTLFFTAVDLFGKTYGKTRRRAMEDNDIAHPEPEVGGDGSGGETV